MKLQKIIEKKPYLAWYVKDTSSLDNESSFEQILNYGDWEDFLEARQMVGDKELKLIFDKLKSKKRVNLRPQTVNFFENYFQKYCPE
jgi:hypothetical protein